MRNHHSSRRQAATVLIRQLPTPQRIDRVTETITRAEQTLLESQGTSLLNYGRDYMRLDESSLIQFETTFEPPAVVMRGSRRRPIADVRLRGSAFRRRA